MSGLVSASLPLQKAIKARLDAAFAAAGVVCPLRVDPSPGKDFPFGVLGTDTEIDIGTKSTRDSGMTHTVRIYSKSFVEAARLATIAIEALTSADPLELDDGLVAAGPGRLEMNEPINERDERGNIYSRAFRIWWGITKQ